MSYIYSPSTLGVPGNQITFNDDSLEPYFRMKSRTPSRRELVEFDIKLPEGLGDADFETEIGKTYFMISGIMYADDETGYDIGRRMLRKVASIGNTQNDPSTDGGYVPYVWSEFDGNKQLLMKVEYVDPPETSRGGGKQPFNLICKVKYPVIFSTQLVVCNVGSLAAGTGTGIGYPFRYPVLYGATTYASSGSLVNSGDLPTYPAGITIYGPINQPRITNVSTGEFIQLNVNLPTGADTLLIAYDQDSMSATVAGNSVLGLLTNDSVPFKLRSGNTNLTLTGSSIGTSAYATVTALSAWPLS